MRLRDNTKPTGRIVEHWRVFKHEWMIEALEPPVKVGAGYRHYRLWDNGEPATGGQWHYTLEEAKARAEYVSNGSNALRVKFLETRVVALQREVRELKANPPKIWVVVHDLDWGMRGERRLHRYYFAEEPTPAEIRAAIELAGYKLRDDWQEPSRSGVITVYEVDYQKQEPRYE